MSTTTDGRRAAKGARGGYGLRTVARMEWHKLRTVRSSWYILAAFAVAMIGLAALVLSHEGYPRLSAADRASFDPLIGLGIGALVRHTAGAICALVGVLFVLPLLFLSPSLANAGQNFLPHPMVNVLTAVTPVPHARPAGLIFGLLCGYAVVTLAAGAWVLNRRDA